MLHPRLAHHSWATASIEVRQGTRRPRFRSRSSPARRRVGHPGARSRRLRQRSPGTRTPNRPAPTAMSSGRTGRKRPGSRG